MAHATVRLPVTSKWAYIDSDTPIGVIDISEQSEVYMKTWTGTAPNWKGSQLFFQVAEFPAALSKKRIYYATAKFAFRTTWHINKYRIMNAKEDFDPATLEYSNKPALYGALNIVSPDVSESQTGQNFKDYELSPTTATAEYLSVNTCKLLKFPTHVLVQTETTSSGSVVLSTTGIAKLWTLTDGVTPPYIEVTYDDSISIGSSIKIANAPTSGYVNPRQSTSFSWIYEKDTSSGYDCFGEDYGQSSATFYWKTSSDESYTAGQISGTTQGVTIPANTFPISSTIQWYVEGTDDGGTTSQTEVYSFSTSAGTVTSTPEAPINTIESNNEEITFEWSYSSADGFPPSRYILRWREMGEQQWNELLDSTTVVTSYTAPANTFPAGEIQWSVLPYNIDGVAGTGTTASFISFGAPEAPSVTATEVPFVTVSWQAEDQQAYKITVDDKTYGPYFGTEKQFVMPEYLEDGTHTITVSIMGTYALWSQAGSVTVTIANEPGEDIELAKEDGIEPRLVWETEEATGDFYIYRNGKLVGHTTESFFYDRFAAGQNSYQVVNKLTSGNYSISEEVTGTVLIAGTCIAALDGGEWIQIDYSRTDQRDPEFSEEIETAYNHLAGLEFPSAVIGTYKNTSMSFSALFLAEQELLQKAFRSLFGMPVIMKLRDGSVYVGIIDAWTRKPFRLWYTEYTFTLRRIAYEDYIDDTM